MYLLYYDLSPATAGSGRINAKERGKKEGRVRRAKKSKGIETHRLKPSTPSQADDAYIGDEERTGEQKKRKTGSGSSTRLPRII